MTLGSLDLLLMTGEVTNIPGPPVANDKRATGRARSCRYKTLAHVKRRERFEHKGVGGLME